jgi:hypothetical protein
MPLVTGVGFSRPAGTSSSLRRAKYPVASKSKDRLRARLRGLRRSRRTRESGRYSFWDLVFETDEEVY